MTIPATAASAAAFEATPTPAAVDASNEGNHVFEPGIVGNLSCKKATYIGTAFLAFPTTAVQVAPFYSECTFLGVSTTVQSSSCTYTFTEPTGSGPYTGKLDIGCATGKTIEWEALGCRVKVGPQTGLGTVTYVNQAKTTIKMGINVTGLTYTSEGFCNGVPGVHSDGVYRGTAIARGEDEEGGPAAVWVS